MKNERLQFAADLTRAFGRRAKSRVVGALTVVAVLVTVLILTNQTTSEAAAVVMLTSPAHGRVNTSADWGTFSHSVREHGGNCNSCHQRNDNAATPKYAGHSACVDCHLTQFVTVETPMCTICHSNVASADAPMRAFPASFNERFNMKFDHAVHNKAGARPAEGCASCHKPLRGGVALSIPVNGLNAHNNCYSCHTPNNNVGGRDIGSCSTCHALGAYSPSTTNGRAFKANFSHAEHDASEGLSCSNCHTVKTGVPQKKQVSLPVVGMHFGASKAVNCMNCHNDKQAFGDRDFADCKRCHTGQTFDMVR